MIASRAPRRRPSLRRRLLGPNHPRTYEAQQALGGLDNPASAQPDGAEGATRQWDGGAQFEAPASSESASAAMKHLHRRLVRLCHPDGAANPSEGLWRHELMIRVNHAAEVHDIFSLRALLREAVGRLAARRSADSPTEVEHG